MQALLATTSWPVASLHAFVQTRRASRYETQCRSDLSSERERLLLLLMHSRTAARAQASRVGGIKGADKPRTYVDETLRHKLVLPVAIDWCEHAAHRDSE